MSIQTKARLKLIVSMVIFGTIGLFVKNIFLPSAEIACYRAVIAVAVLAVVMLVTGRFSTLQINKKDLWKLVLSGLAMGFNWIFLFEAYRHTSVAISTLSYYFAPTLVVLISVVILKEKLKVRQILCFLGSTVGLILCIGVSGKGGNDLIGILYGLSAACFYATIVLLNKVMGEIDGLTRTFLQFVSASILLVIYVSFTGGFHLGSISGLSLCNLLLLGVVHTGITYYLYLTSLSDLQGQQAAILSYIDPMIAVVISVTLLGEAVSCLQLLGGFTILVFSFINEVRILPKGERR